VALGEEEWSGAASGAEPGEQVGGVGVPVDLAGDACFAGDRGGFGWQVKVGDVEGEDLVGSGCGVIGQAPEGFLAQREVVAVPEGL
jgi:hypothetical protein